MIKLSPLLLLAALPQLEPASAQAPESTAQDEGSQPGRAPQAPSLEAEGDGAAGHVRLQWSTATGEPGEFELQEASDSGFGDATTRYQGQHNASVLSGLTDGQYFYRVRERIDSAHDWSPWSEAVSFEIAHHPLSLATVLCILGALVFAATATFLSLASRRANRDG